MTPPFRPEDYPYMVTRSINCDSRHEWEESINMHGVGVLRFATYVAAAERAASRTQASIKRGEVAVAYTVLRWRGHDGWVLCGMEEYECPT